MDRRCSTCGYRINPIVMREEGDLSDRDWSNFNINPVESWCAHFSKMVPDTRENCPDWISYETYDAQMSKYGR